MSCTKARPRILTTNKRVQVLRVIMCCVVYGKTNGTREEEIAEIAEIERERERNLIKLKKKKPTTVLRKRRIYVRFHLFPDNC